jgi:hypothetical protein
MTKPRSKPRAATRSRARKTGKPKSRARSVPVSSKPATGSHTKHARIIAMLRTPAGATIASLVIATEWQQHSVRGFLAGVVRKKLGLNLVSEQTDKGRVYRIRDGKPSPVSADRAKQAA